MMNVFFPCLLSYFYWVKCDIYWYLFQDVYNKITYQTTPRLYVLGGDKINGHVTRMSGKTFWLRCTGIWKLFIIEQWSAMILEWLFLFVYGHTKQTCNRCSTECLVIAWWNNGSVHRTYICKEHIGETLPNIYR